MKQFEDFLNKHWSKIGLVFLILIFVNTCGNPNKITNKRIDTLSHKVDSLSTEITEFKKVTVTKTDLKIEGLKAEKRMIQSTDRKLWDVARQTEIDKEIQTLEGK